MPFGDGQFAAVFFMVVLSHVKEGDRSRALAEAVRVSLADVALFETKTSALAAIRASDLRHPEPARPPDYWSENTAEWSIITGVAMDIFVFTKPAHHPESTS